MFVKTDHQNRNGDNPKRTHKFNRCAHFKSFGESSLDFEVVYWVNSPDYNRYMDIQQTINLALKARVESLGLAFAFPTRTLHVSTLPATAEPAALSARRG